MADEKPIFLAIDVGGTKIEVCNFDKNYNLISSKRFSTSDFPIKSVKFLDSVKKIIEDNISPEIKKVGVSFNCVIDKGIITYSSLLGGPVKYPFVEKFSKEFGVAFNIENDVNAMAIAESKAGKAKDVHSFLLINLGTGIRLSFTYKGERIGGYTNNAGEICQTNVIVPELSHKVFKIDDFLSGKGITNIYKELAHKELSAKEIFSLIDNDALAQKTLDIFTSHFARFLGEISYLYNPEIIVLNGSLKKAANLYLPKALDIYHKNNFDFFFFKDIVISDIDHGACLGVVL